MPNYTIIETAPGGQDFHLFENLPNSLYEKNSQRFILGNDPINSEHLAACLILMEKNTPIARCAVYTKPGIHYKNTPACSLGSFECIEDTVASNSILTAAVNKAKSLGFHFAIGPMEGSTWNNYRFSDHNKHANFFMEPFHHSYYGKLWSHFGFNPIARYISNVDTQLTFDASSISSLEKLYTSQGATFRSINLEDLENDLRKLAQFNNEAFKDNFLFTPIEEDNFVDKYAQLKKYFDPELIWIVEDEEGVIQAISFSIPDYLDNSGKTLIIKSLARRKDTKFRGIGSYLAGKTYQIATKRKFEKVIHALMIQDNHSVVLSNNFEGGNYKSYTLFGMEL